MNVRIASIVSLVVTTIALAAGAQQLESRRTRDLDLIYYDKAHEYLSYHLARSFENSLAFHRKLFGYDPSDPVVILMQDFGDYGHEFDQDLASLEEIGAGGGSDPGFVEELAELDVPEDRDGGSK